jgi:LuxR family quorum-sensing system transcriptional regulator CciR
MFDRVDAFVRDVNYVASEAGLAGLIGEISRELGFDYFALTHHVNPRRTYAPVIRIDSYPADWVAYFDRENLGSCDPVHRASHRTSVGFAWSRLPALIHLTARDREVLDLATGQGIGNGFTVPANVPGEANGSCSFATRARKSFTQSSLTLAQLVGAFGFEAARRLWRMNNPLDALPRLTERQRDCVVWAARGKSDWEISRILGVSHETVIQHLKQARERYGVGKRTQLAIHALFDGSISFNDILRSPSPHFWK